MRRSILSVTAIAALFALTGCAAFPLACPAIGYFNTASVELSQPAAGLQLELCGGEGCVPGSVEMPVEIGSTATPIATGIFGLDGDSKTGWAATLLDAPSQFGFRVSNAAGTVFSEGAVDIAWTRVNGTEQCGGSRHVDVTIPL